MNLTGSPTSRLGMCLESAPFLLSAGSSQPIILCGSCFHPPGHHLLSIILVRLGRLWRLCHPRRMSSFLSLLLAQESWGTNSSKKSQSLLFKNDSAFSSMTLSKILLAIYLFDSVSWCQEPPPQFFCRRVLFSRLH